MKPEINVTGAICKRRSLNRIWNDYWAKPTNRKLRMRRLPNGSRGICARGVRISQDAGVSNRKYSRCSPALCLGDGCGCIRRPRRPHLAR